MATAGQGGLPGALELSERMLGAARAGEWTTVAGLQSECDRLMRQHHPADDSTRAALLELEQSHRSLIELACKARDDVASQLGQLRHNHRALNAYLAPADDR